VATFQEAVDFLEQGLNYEKTQRWLYNTRWLNLDRTNRMLEALGDPHLRYHVIHVAGTKGKGSTAGAIAQCLRRCGRRTGLLTSPHLVTHRERIRVDGAMIDTEAFQQIVRTMQPYVEGERLHERAGRHKAPTYFEMLTALAFEHFARAEVDWAVVEVGLGGRLDSTNVVAPRCCVITTIGLDHVSKLGESPEAIAGEKAGILKAGVPVVIGRQSYPGALETLRRAADARGCPRWEVGRELRVRSAAAMSAPADRPAAEVGWRFALQTPRRNYPDLHTPLLGRHQVENLAAAIGAIEMIAGGGALQADPERIAQAVAECRMPGRVELLQRGPALVLDVAHTVESVQALLDALDVHFPGRPLRVVFGCSRDKNLEGILSLLAPRCIEFTATQASLPRALAVEEVARAARVHLEPLIVPNPSEAVLGALSRARPQEVVCVTGSFYVAGEVRAAWLREHPDCPA
jgi:dihydrofolate synthase/folylpolyglutamate synthase